MPARNASSPTQATSWRSTDAPFAYEMPSKFVIALPVSATRAEIGWVDGDWSAAYPHIFRLTVKSTHALSNLVAELVTRYPMYSAKDSFNHRSSHQRMLTRSPNHICAISCAITYARDSRWASVTADRKIISSRKVTQPGFSIAPALNSGTKTWSYVSPNG